jgi:hypothetical protein
MIWRTIGLLPAGEVKPRHFRPLPEFTPMANDEHCKRDSSFLLKALQ